MKKTILEEKTTEDQEEAIDIANDTEYGLGAGVFTKDLKKHLGLQAN
mgnify:CR=1 FL=1